MLGGLSQTPGYLSGGKKADVQAEFQKQVDVFVANDVDFLLCEVSIVDCLAEDSRDPSS